MSYLYLGAILAIGVKSQTFRCGNYNCDPDNGFTGCVTLNEIRCSACSEDLDCNNNAAFWDSLYNITTIVDVTYTCSSIERDDLPGYDYPICIPAGISLGCETDKDCTAPLDTCFIDTNGTNICYLGCSSNSDCSVFDGYGCQTNPDNGVLLCGPAECSVTSDCPGSKVCNVEDLGGKCVECNEAVDCSADSSCVNNVCLADSCTTDDDCGDYVCNDAGSCEICTRDSDCTSYGDDPVYTCQSVDGVNGCYGYIVPDNGINQITTYIAMIIMAVVTVNI